MTSRKHSPLHDFWHIRVEGQLRDAIYAHPNWFCFESEQEKKRAINSMAKRIVGEIVAGQNNGCGPRTDAGSVSVLGDVESAAHVDSNGGDVTAGCTPSESEVVKCPRCGCKRDYNAQYDAFYCAKCNVWLEKMCSDWACDICAQRPSQPFPPLEGIK